MIGGIFLDEGILEDLGASLFREDVLINQGAEPAAQHPKAYSQPKP